VEHVVGTPADERPDPLAGPLPVLLVEDDEADIELAKLALDGAGIDVELRIARDGAEAISYLQLASPVPALVLLDLKMPVMDGHTMLERLGSELGKDTLNDLNIVIVSSSASDSDRERAHLLGARAYVVKDPDFDQFQATITSLVTEAAGG
ncbi:MAG: response regulator, partial [Ilumatobacter sp.]|uniref:response regulator n=1 Tax=Ilumatobacter sp. TaxID=1967498 RepID=UPI003C765000